MLNVTVDLHNIIYYTFINNKLFMSTENNLSTKISVVFLMIHYNNVFQLKQLLIKHL